MNGSTISRTSPETEADSIRLPEPGASVWGRAGESRRDDGHQAGDVTRIAEIGSRPRAFLASFIAIAVALLIAILGTIRFLRRERTIYFWDSVGYWRISRGWAHLMGGPLLRSAKELWRSIRADDYNLIPAVPIGTWMTMAGASRMAYLLAIVTLYVSGVLIALRLVTGCFLGGERTGRLRFWCDLVVVVWVLLVPAFWTPILRGYLDVGGVAIACVILWLYFRPGDRPASLRDSLRIGILLGVLYLFRRWYAFWVVAFLAAVALDSIGILWRDWRANGLKLGRAIRAVLPLAVMGSSMGSLLVVLAWPLLHRVAATSYADIYSAYRPEQSLWRNLDEIVIAFGGFYLVYLAAGFVFLLGCRGARRPSLFLAVQSLLIVYAFSSVQALDTQHLYLLLPGFLLVAGVFAVKVAGLLPGWWLRVGWLALVVSIGLVSSIPVFVESARPLLVNRLGRWVPTRACDPLVRTDLREFARMLSVIDGYLQASDGRFYVLSSSRTLSGDHLAYAEYSLPVRFQSNGRHVDRSYHVDKRDGFPADLLEASLVVVGVPIQYHLLPSDQRVVGIPAESLLQRRDIGGAFERLPEVFSLENGVRAVLFRKVRPISPGEIARLSERFRAAYPDCPFIYEPRSTVLHSPSR